jgi:hypothetical protein
MVCWSGDAFVIDKEAAGFKIWSVSCQIFPSQTMVIGECFHWKELEGKFKVNGTDADFVDDDDDSIPSEIK